jgi:AcrR family transcriptional regulator
MPSRRSKKLEQRETMILRAAAHLIEKVGYANMNIEMIIDEVGIARATLYQHFRNKEDIVARLVLRDMDNLEEFIVGTKGAPLERLEAILRYILTGGKADDFSVTLAKEEVVPMFFSHTDFSNRYKHIYALIDELIQAAKAAGSIAPDLSNDLLISMMFNMMELTKIQFGTASNENTVEQAIRIFLQGIRP